ncbi:hypothetical protein ACB094_06G232800 [Castanea mollissima]
MVVISFSYSISFSCICKAKHHLKCTSVIFIFMDSPDFCTQCMWVRGSLDSTHIALYSLEGHRSCLSIGHNLSLIPHFPYGLFLADCRSFIKETPSLTFWQIGEL